MITEQKYMEIKLRKLAQKTGCLCNNHFMCSTCKQYPTETELKEMHEYELYLSSFKLAESSQYHQAAEAIANLVVEKQKAYGNSFGKAGKIMAILYPEGIPLDKIDDALTVVRIIDKLFRIATDKDALGESPFKDIMGYSLLAVVNQAQRG